MSEYALGLWRERLDSPGDDLISMLVHSRIDGEAMTPERYIGTFILLVAAGNETTRNSLSGGFLALADHPAEKRRLIADQTLLGSAASEIVRWVSPVMHMRRTAVEHAQIGDQSIRPGDKIILWYCSGNRDEAMFTDRNGFDVARAEPPHIGFGTGQHFCLGARLAEMQSARSMKSSSADIPKRNRAVLFNECGRTSLLAISRFRPAFTVEGSGPSAETNFPTRESLFRSHLLARRSRP